jgi:hypothetical protein
MAFVPSTKSRLYYGAMDLAGYTRNVQQSWNADMLDVTTLADTAKAMIPGQDTSTLTVDMVMDVDAAAGTQWTVLAGMKAAGGDYPFTLLPSGTTVGSECWMVNAIETSFNSTSAAAGTVDLAISAQTDGDTDLGVVLEPATAVTIDGNGTARDNGAASSNGGVAHLHVTAFSGLTNNIVTIEHSVDGSTSWATLVTFSTYTGATSQRVEVAAGTTVRRYLRVVDNVTGTGSTTRFVSFARR